jgi:hypothetical protein
VTLTKRFLFGDPIKGTVRSLRAAPLRKAFVQCLREAQKGIPSQTCLIHFGFKTQTHTRTQEAVTHRTHSHTHTLTHTHTHAHTHTRTHAHPRAHTLTHTHTHTHNTTEPTKESLLGAHTKRLCRVYVQSLCGRPMRRVSAEGLRIVSCVLVFLVLTNSVE